MRYTIMGRECWERSLKEISARDFVSHLMDAANCGQDVWTWTGKDRDGAPLMVTWVQGPVTGQALSVYEITKR
jgi:hypothetical protein